LLTFLQALLKAVLGAFLEEAQSLVTLVSSASQPTATPPPAFDPASRTALGTFTNRRLKLIKNMLIWRRYAPQEIQQLVGMVLGQVIRPCLTRCWG
jgi:GC-rich sequence DNA-binding factor